MASPCMDEPRRYARCEDQNRRSISDAMNTQIANELATDVTITLPVNHIGLLVSMSVVEAQPVFGPRPDGRLRVRRTKERPRAIDHRPQRRNASLGCSAAASSGRSSFPHGGDEPYFLYHSQGGLTSDNLISRFLARRNQVSSLGRQATPPGCQKAETRKSCLPSGNSYQVEIPCWTSVFIDLRLANRMH